LSDAVALAAQQCEDTKDSRFMASFESSVVGALHPRQRIWLQSDATGKDPILSEKGEAVLDARGEPVHSEGTMEYGVDQVAKYKAILERIEGLDRESHVIVGEMLPVVASAMEHGEELRGLLITPAVCR